jgi:hypothetical protein
VLFAIATSPLMVPLIDGLKVTVIVHVAPAPSVPPQGVVPLAAAVYFPIAVIPEIESEDALLFFTATASWRRLASSPN